MPSAADGTGQSADGVDGSIGGLRTVSEPGDGSTSRDADGIPLSDRYEVAEEIGRGGFAVVHFDTGRFKLGHLWSVQTEPPVEL